MGYRGNYGRRRESLASRQAGTIAYALLRLDDSARCQRGQGEEEDHLVYW
jgi:hypothetical protein